MDTETGTIMVNVKGKPYKTIHRVLKAVTQVTGVECGYDMNMTLSGEMMFYHMTEKESDEVRSILEGEMDPISFESLAYCFDDDFQDEDEEEDGEEE